MPNKYLSKYVHLIYTKDKKFLAPLIDAINDERNGLNPQDHTFVTLYEELYEALKHHPNVILDSKPGNLFNRYGRSCKWIISHAKPSEIQFLYTPRSIKKKIIHRYWGNSVTSNIKLDPRKPIQFIKDGMKLLAYRWLYHSFGAVAVANAVDIRDISRQVKNVRFIRMPYLKKDTDEIIRYVEEAKGVVREHDAVTNIMIGHRGTSENHHIQLIDTLISRFGGENIHLYVPLSYGSKAYIQKVKEYCAGIDSVPITVIEDLMPYREYAQFLNRMDICILDGKASYALGNISILLRMKKTMYLNGEGVIVQTFQDRQIPYRTIDEIDQIDFTAFTKQTDYAGVDLDGLQIATFAQQIECWKKIISEFN